MLPNLRLKRSNCPFTGNKNKEDGHPDSTAGELQHYELVLEPLSREISTSSATTSSILNESSTTTTDYSHHWETNSSGHYPQQQQQQQQQQYFNNQAFYDDDNDSDDDTYDDSRYHNYSLNQKTEQRSIPKGSSSSRSRHRKRKSKPQFGREAPLRQLEQFYTSRCLQNRATTTTTTTTAAAPQEQPPSSSLSISSSVTTPRITQRAATTNPTTTNFAVITGSSGTGKTSLAARFGAYVQRSTQRKRAGLFVRGKSDQLHRGTGGSYQPFCQALTMYCFGELKALYAVAAGDNAKDNGNNDNDCSNDNNDNSEHCLLTSQPPSPELQQLRTTILQHIQGDEQVVAQIIPGLSLLLGLEMDQDNDDDGNNDDNNNDNQQDSNEPPMMKSHLFSSAEDLQGAGTGFTAARTRFAIRRLMHAIGVATTTLKRNDLKSNNKMNDLEEGEEDSDDHNDDYEQNDQETTTEQIGPLCCLFLDDLQWFEEESLSLLAEVLLDKNLQDTWIFLGACRGDEVGFGDALARLFRRLEDDSGIGIQDIRLGNLTFEEMPEMVAQHVSKLFLSAPSSSTVASSTPTKPTESPDSTVPNLNGETPLVQAISKYVFHYTRGNLFATYQFLRTLQECGALTRRNQQRQRSDSIRSADANSVEHDARILVEGSIRWNRDIADAHFLHLLSRGVSSSSSKWSSSSSRTSETERVAARAIDPLLIVRTRLFLMEKSVVDLLMRASCFGASFDISLLLQSFPESSDGQTLADLLKDLHKAEQLQFVDRVDSEQDTVRFRFVHDKVQQAAYSLCDDNNQTRADIHFSIGTNLLRVLSDSEVKSHAVIIADQLCRASSLITGFQNQVEFCQICVQAASNLQLQYDYQASLSYLDSGIKALCGGRRNEQDVWSCEYDLCIQLWSMAAELSSAQGEHEKTRQYVATILANSRSMLDQAKANLILMLSLGSQNRIKEAMGMVPEILTAVGEDVPATASRSRAVVALLRTTTTLRRMSDDDILGLPMLTDPKKLLAMVTLHKAYLYAHFSMKELAAVYVAKIIRLTLKYGLCPVSGVALAIIGVAMSMHMGDLENGGRYGALAFRVLDKVKSTYQLNRVKTAVFGVIMVENHNMHECMPPLLDAFHDGMKEGDTEGATFAMVAYLLDSMWASHSSVSSLFSQALQTREQMSAYRYTHNITLQAPFLQFAANLNGTGNDDLSSLNGAYCREDALLKEAIAENREAEIIHILTLKLWGLVLMSEFDKTTVLLKSLRHYGLSSVHHVIKSAAIFLEGLATLAYKQTPLGLAISGRQNRKSNSRINFCIERMKRFAKVCPVNELHRLRILQAELAAVNGNVRNALVQYEEAAELAKNGGFLWEQALSSERAGSLLLERGKGPVTLGQKEKGLKLLATAVSVYSQWGANPKAQQLRQRMELFR